MLFDSQADQITARHIMQLAEHERSSRISYYLKRHKMHKGVVTTPSEADYDEALCLELFPRALTETIVEYRERLKVWVPLGRLIVDRLVELSLKGVAYSWEDASGQPNQAANDALGADLEYNDWERQSRKTLSNSLGIGETSTWLEYRGFDPATGKPFDNAGRVRFIERFPWIAEPIVHPDNVTDIIGSVALYDIDNYAITPNLTAQMRLDGKSKRKIELWIAAQYDPKSGEKISDGGYWEYQNETLTGDESFIEFNPYGLVPVVHWIYDTDETQYRGISYHDRYADAWLKLSRVASSEVAQIQYLVSVWKLLFSGDKPSKMEFRPNGLYAFPQGADQPTELGQTERMLDLNEERQFKAFLVNLIGQAGGYSGDLLQGLEGIGKISESGIARKIVYEQTLDTVRGIRTFYGAGMRQLMRSCNAMRGYHAKFNSVGLTPRVNFDDNIMPVDENEAFDLLVKKRNERVITEEEFLMQANRNIKTVEEARQRLETRQVQTPTQRRLLSNGNTNRRA